jgi:hypothetical protein
MDLVTKGRGALALFCVGGVRFGCVLWTPLTPLLCVCVGWPPGGVGGGGARGAGRRLFLAIAHPSRSPSFKRRVRLLWGAPVLCDHLNWW